MANMDSGEWMEPTIEEMSTALLTAGWKPIRVGVWQAPTGSLYVGPAQAYRYMMAAKKVIGNGMHVSRQGKL